MSLMDREYETAQHGEAEPLRWADVQRLYVFCRTRAIERIIAAPGGAPKERRDLTTLEALYGKARQHGSIVADCATTYFRTQALRDADHPDFVGEWI